MKNHLILLVVVCALALPFSGCAVHQHTFGSGPQSGADPEVHAQWYTLMGFFPIGNKVDGGQIAGQPDCKITTEYGPIDCLLAPFSLFIMRRTIIIER